jgi:benzoyl-CoA reductase subunit D
MITAGIDMGAAFAKMIILKDGKVIGKGISKVTLEPDEAVTAVQAAALKNAGLKSEDIEKICATGSGNKLIKNATLYVSDITADARGVHYLDKSIRTIIDIGGEEARAIKVDEEGKVINFAVNDKCAAGAGAFVEAMARALELSLADFSAYSLRSTKKIPINAQCAIFAESEVVSLINELVPREDICRAVHDGISERISSMAKRVIIEEKVGLIGGPAYNRGLVEALKNSLGMDIVVLPDPEYVSALGAALIAASKEEG